MRSAIRFFAALGVALIATGAATAPPSSRVTDPQQPSAALPDADAQVAAQLDDNNDGVAATVNDQIISEYDVRQRMALFIATSGVNPTADQLKQIRDQVIQQLETERLELAEAQKNNISVSSAEVDKALGNILESNHLTVQQLTAVLARSNVDIATLRAQIATQLAWEKTVDDALGDRVHITAEDVNAEMKRLAAGANKPHYQVAEIFLAVDSPEQETKVAKQAQDIETQLQGGAPFAEIARQFSQSPSAAEGGDIGIVQDGQLDKPLNDALSKLKIGEITQPIRSAGGYYILQLRNRQEAMGTKVADVPKPDPHPTELPLARVLLPLGGKPSQDMATKAMHAGEVIRSHITSCDMLPALMKQLPGAELFKLGTMKLADLSPEIQQAIANTEPGGSAEPFLSSAGVEIIVRCDPPAAQQASVFVMPTRDQVEQGLFEQQISTLARQYLSDLRREADVETR